MLRYFLAIILLLAAACDSSSPNPNPEEAGDPLTAELGDAVLMAWIGQGSAPGQHSSSAPGSLVLIDGDNKINPLMELPNGTSRVQACGTSPDRRFFAFIVAGSTAGTLYQMDGTNQPVEIGPTHAMACLGMSTFRYSADSARFGYIDFVSDATTSNFPGGTLKIVDARRSSQLAQFENVAHFDYAGESVMFISFFTNNQGEAAEAAVFEWTSGNPVEISTLFAGNRCQFRAGQVAAVDASRLVIVMGQTCPGPRHEWVLYTVDVPASAAARLLSGPTGGNFGGNSRAMALFAAPDDRNVYFSYTNGAGFHIADWRAFDMQAVRVSEPVIRNAVMPRFVTSRIYNPADNALPVLSSDGRWLAVATNNANNDAAVNILDLNMPDLPPININAGTRGNTVSSMAFTPDSTRLLFVAGGHSGENNSLFSVDLATASETRIIRGRYAPQMIVSPDGSDVALAEWRVTDTLPNYLNLVVIDLALNESGTVFSGRRTSQTAQRFVYPLSWRN